MTFIKRIIPLFIVLALLFSFPIVSSAKGTVSITVDRTGESGSTIEATENSISIPLKITAEEGGGELDHFDANLLKQKAFLNNADRTEKVYPTTCENIGASEDGYCFVKLNFDDLTVATAYVLCIAQKGTGPNNSYGTEEYNWTLPKNYMDDVVVTSGDPYKYIQWGDNQIDDHTQVQVIYYSNGTVELGNSGSGEMRDWTGQGQSAWSMFFYPKTIQSIDIKNGVKHIGNYTFSPLINVTTVTTGYLSPLTSIGEYSFKGCTSLKDFYLYANADDIEIADTAFDGCSNVTIHVKPGQLEKYQTKFASLANVTFAGDIQDWITMPTGAKFTGHGDTANYYKIATPVAFEADNSVVFNYSVDGAKNYCSAVIRNADGSEVEGAVCSDPLGDTSRTVTITGLADNTTYQLYWDKEQSNGKLVKDVIMTFTTGEHNHILDKTDAKAPTCTETGNTDYYTCSVCGKLFTDEAAATETTLADVTIAIDPDAHDMVEGVCSRCGIADIAYAVIASVEDQVYDGNAKTPALAVTLGETALVAGTDYDVAYADNTKCGTATVTITGKGNYLGTNTATFDIVMSDEASAEIDDLRDSSVATVAQLDAVVDKDKYTPASYQRYADAYAAFKAAMLEDNNQDSLKTIREKRKAVTNAYLQLELRTNIKDEGAVVTLATTSYTYDGKAKSPAVTVTLGDVTLVKGTDYTVAYKNNTAAGTATVTITGINDYVGTLSKTFKIAAASISKATVTLPKTSYAYTGKAQSPAPTVKVGSTTLKKGTDYTVSYKNNTNAGTATVTITGKGNYSGSVSKTFKITKIANPMTAKAAKSSFSFSLSKVKSAAQTVAAPVTVSKAQGTVTYKKTSGNSNITIDSKTGKLTVKKGTKAGTYTIKVQVKAAGNTNYNAKTTTISFKVVVK